MKSIIDQAKSEINQMKVLLQTYRGDKEKPQKRIESMERLLDYAIASTVRNEDHEDTTAQLIMCIGELNSRLKEVTMRLDIAEKIGEFNVDEMVTAIAKGLNATILNDSKQATTIASKG